MSSSFNTQGSVQSNPIQGLNNSVQGLFSSAPKVQSSFTQPQSTPGVMSSTNASIAPSAPQVGVSSPGLLQQHQPTTSVASKTDSQGNTVKFAPAPTPLAPDDPSHKYNTATGQLNTNYSGYVAPNASGGSTNPVGTTTATQIQNVGNTGSQTSNESQTQQNLINQSQAPSQAYTDAQNAALATKAQETALANDYAKKTNNIAQTAGFLTQQNGEQGLLQNQYNIGQNALAQQYAGDVGQISNANTQQGLEVQAGQSAYSGAQTQAQRNLAAQEGVLGAVQPQPYGITTTPYNPGTNSFGTLPGGTNGATEAGRVQGQIAAGATSVQNDALVGKAMAQLPALQDAISKDNFNPTNVTYLNQLTDWAKGNLSDSKIPEIQNALNDIAGSLGGVLGVPSSGGSDLRTSLAQGLVNGLQSGKSIQESLQFALNQAVAGNAGYLAGAQGGASTQTPSTGTISSSVVPGNYVLENGQWVYKQ